MIQDKMQRIKRASLETKGIYISCDLSKTTWMEKVINAGYNKQQKTFGSLLGISYYLREEDFEKLLVHIGKIMIKGSKICFDYPSKDESQETKTNQTLATGAGEEMKSLYTYESIKTLLHRCGFKIQEHLDYHEITERYFKVYNDENLENPMQAPRGIGYITAVKI